MKTGKNAAERPNVFNHKEVKNSLVNYGLRSLPRTEHVPGSARDWQGWSWDALVTM